MSKLFTPNMYCWIRKTVIAIHWAHLRLNGICIKSFTHRTEPLILRDAFSGNAPSSNVYK